MSQSRRSCLFCSRLGTTREHIIAQWIGRALEPSSAPGISYIYRHGSANPEAGVPMRVKRAKRPAYFTWGFCRECNGGWMSQLEQRVQPVLEPLLHGQPRTLSTGEQRLLAFWATKTVLAFQTIEEPITKWARAEDYVALYRDQRPLLCSQVWLGANAHGEPAWYRAHSVRLPEHPAAAVDGFGATLTVGHAVFYLLFGYPGRTGMRLRYDAASAMREIWPGRQRDVAWPPPLILREREPHGLPEFLAQHSVLVGA